MLPDDLYAVAQREALVWIVGNGGVERSVPDGDARRRGNHPPDVLVVQIGRDIVQVRIGQLAEQLVHAVIELRGRAPKLAAFGTQLLEQAERVELAFAFRRGARSGERNMNDLRAGAKTPVRSGPRRVR